jgi:hypothetical protein
MTTTEFQIGGHTFKAEGLAPKKAWHVTRRLAPVFGGLKEALPTMLVMLRSPAEGSSDEAVFENAATVFEPIAQALARMPEDDSDYIMDACLRAVSVKMDGDRGWARVQAPGGALMFDWITMQMMIQIVWHVLRANLTGFFPAGAPA